MFFIWVMRMTKTMRRMLGICWSWLTVVLLYWRLQDHQRVCSLFFQTVFFFFLVVLRLPWFSPRECYEVRCGFPMVEELYCIVGAFVIVILWCSYWHVWPPGCVWRAYPIYSWLFLNKYLSCAHILLLLFVGYVILSRAVWRSGYMTKKIKENSHARIY